MEIRIPKYIDAPAQFLWWDADEFIVVVAGFSLGIVGDYPTTGGLIGIGLARLAGQLKSGKAEAYMFHVLYRYGLIRGNPPGNISEMYE